MYHPYQLVVFDWEGTISDTLGVALHTLASEVKRLGFGTVDLTEARNYIQLGLEDIISTLLPQLSEEQQQQLVLAMHRAMMARGTSTYLMPGVEELIERLHNKKIDLAVATNKGYHSLQKAIQDSNLKSFFKITRSAGQVPAKPCPQMLEEIIEEFGQSPASTLMIGDSVTDIEMAKSINVDAIGIDFYHQQESALRAAGAIAVFDNYQQVEAFLKLRE